MNHSYGFMSRNSVQKYFMALCKRSSKTTIDWDKFRKLDKKGIFEPYSNSYLSLMKYRNKMKEKGLCVRCGKNPPKSKELCEECLQKKNKKKRVK